jgi:hypothetical protein
MKKIVLFLAFLTAVYTGSGQGQFIIGVKGGIDGCFYQFNSSAVNIPVNGVNVGSDYTRVVSKGPSIPALFELIYGTKKFRVGYQFEYERILTTSYRVHVFNASGTYGDTSVYDPTITQHFFCHNLLLEYIVFDNHKNFRLVPGADLAPYDVSALNANRFKFGGELNLEYYLGPYSVVTTPNFTVAPIKAVADPNEKGYMFFVGINIGIRFNVTKSKQEASQSPSKKKKKEYYNPEEDN